MAVEELRTLGYERNAAGFWCERPKKHDALMVLAPRAPRARLRGRRDARVPSTPAAA
jgi:hypothetical protein